MSGLPVSLENYLARTTTIVTAVSEASGYSVQNVKTAGNPFTPYKSGAAGAGQIVTWDYGSALPVGVWAFGRLNFTSLTIQADDAPTFNSAAGSPQFSQVITAAEALNSRIHGSYRPPAPVTRQWNRMIIANQATLATVPHAAGAAFYLAGWIWAGAVTLAPRHILDHSDLERHEPTDAVELPSGGHSISRMGYEFLTLSAKRLAGQSGGIGLDTELRAYMALERAWAAADIALVLPSPNVPSDAYIFRRIKGAAWSWGGAFSEGDLTLEEVAQ